MFNVFSKMLDILILFWKSYVVNVILILLKNNFIKDGLSTGFHFRNSFL